MKKYEITTEEYTAVVKARKATQNKRIARRLQVIELRYEGKTSKEIAEKGNGKDSLSYSEQNPDIFRNLKPESFLMQLGYNTFVPQEERYSILRYVMRIYGQDMIIRLLRFFISIHKGDKKMQRACQIWLEDLERCLEQ